MPFVFAIMGVLLLVVAIQGTQGQAFAMLKGEFTGSNSFVVFAAAIVILGALAYIKPIRPIAFGMIGLVLLAMFLKNGKGFVAQFNNALRNPTAPDAVASTTAAATANPLAPGNVTVPTVPGQASNPGVAVMPNPNGTTTYFPIPFPL